MAVSKRKWKNGGKGWQADVCEQLPMTGETIRRRKLFARKADADDWERVTRTAIINGTWTRERKEVPTLGEFVPDYLKNSEVKRLNAPSTIEWKRARLDGWIVPELGGVKLDAVTEDRLVAFRASMIAEKKGGRKGAKPKTANAVKIVCEMIRDAGLNPPRVKPLPESRDVAWVTPEEASALAAHCDPTFATMVKVAFLAGLRLGELRALQWADVDLKAGTIHVCHAFRHSTLGAPKGKRARTVVSDGAVAALRAHPRRLGCPWVFSTPEGKPIPEVTCVKAIRRAYKAAKVREADERKGWHALRHGCAVALINSGEADVYDVAQYLGHSSVKVTERYYLRWLESRRRKVGGILSLPGTLTAQNQGAKHGKAAN